MERIGTKALIASTAALIAGVAYIDGHYGLSRDIKTLLSDRKFGQRMGARIQDLGDVTSIYGNMRTAPPEVEGLWFEGRSWTYAEILRGENNDNHRLWGLSNSVLLQRRILLHRSFTIMESGRILSLLSS